MDNTPTFDQGCESVRGDIISAISHVRDLLVVANEVAPKSGYFDLTLDESQGEVIANATLALRALEEAAMRVAHAQHVFLGDDTLVPAAPAAAPADAVAPTAEEAQPADATAPAGAEAPAAEAPAAEEAAGADAGE
ncbi:MAG: hypothetical protein KGI03_00790 [Patescibacteria group bacterium]|nr:hypothetical protein [Patescibacteria group bacterium]